MRYAIIFVLLCFSNSALAQTNSKRSLPSYDIFHNPPSLEEIDKAVAHEDPFMRKAIVEATFRRLSKSSVDIQKRHRNFLQKGIRYREKLSKEEAKIDDFYNEFGESKNDRYYLLGDWRNAEILDYWMPKYIQWAEANNLTIPGYDYEDISTDSYWDHFWGAYQDNGVERVFWLFLSLLLFLLLLPLFVPYRSLNMRSLIYKASKVKSKDAVKEVGAKIEALLKVFGTTAELNLLSKKLSANVQVTQAATIKLETKKKKRVSNPTIGLSIDAQLSNPKTVRGLADVMLKKAMASYGIIQEGISIKDKNLIIEGNKTERCKKCAGTKEVSCITCGGSGRIQENCHRCNGMGSTMHHSYAMNQKQQHTAFNRHTCGRCGGSGKEPSRACACGNGRMHCGNCDKSGNVHFTEIGYPYLCIEKPEVILTGVSNGKDDTHEINRINDALRYLDGEITKKILREKSEPVNIQVNDRGPTPKIKSDHLVEIKVIRGLLNNDSVSALHVSKGASTFIKTHMDDFIEVNDPTILTDNLRVEISRASVHDSRATAEVLRDNLWRSISLPMAEKICALSIKTPKNLGLHKAKLIWGVAIVLISPFTWYGLHNFSGITYEDLFFRRTPQIDQKAILSLITIISILASASIFTTIFLRHKAFKAATIAKRKQLMSFNFSAVMIVVAFVSIMGLLVMGDSSIDNHTSLKGQPLFSAISKK